MKNERFAHAASAAPAARLALVAGFAISLTSFPALAAPQGAQVVRGDVQLTRQGDSTIIRASDGAIINYRSFDIAGNESVQFLQPDAAARVLNRINSATPTRIDGALTANGRVYIVNPAGVVFGANSVVDAAGVVAAAGRLSDADFVAGVDHFTDVTGSIINRGIITANAAHFIGQHIENHGSIISPNGVVSLLVGNDVFIGEEGGSIFVRLDGAALEKAGAAATNVSHGTDTTGIVNTGTIDAGRGAAILGAGDTYSLAIFNQGEINAPGGSIEVIAHQGAVRNEGVLSASVHEGAAGEIVMLAPIIEQAGIVEADASSGAAGDIRIDSSLSTTLADGSVTSAAGGDGLANGGELLVHARAGDTRVEKGALVDISGGELGGDGGSAEISAGKRLDVRGTLAGDSRDGYAKASILFDPLDIQIFAGLDGDQPNDPDAADGSVAGTDSPGDTFMISTGAIEGFAGDVFLQAIRDILVGESINKTNGGLELDAGRDILLSGNFAGFQDISIAANFLDFTAGRNIVDGSLGGALLFSTATDITLEARTGAVDFGIATVPNGRTLSITQAQSKFVGAGPSGFVGNRENTNLVVNITNGWLVFGGDFGGEGGPQELLSVDATASQFLRVDDDIIAGDFVRMRAEDDVLIDGFIHSQNLIELHAGTDGSGMLSFLSPGLDFGADTIVLWAGNNSGLGNASVDARTNMPIFRGAALGATRPDDFTFRQDAAVSATDLPLLTQFGTGNVTGMNYRIQSDDSSVTIMDGSFVEGSDLQLRSQIGSFINDDLNLERLLVVGPAIIDDNVTTTGTQTYSGDATLTANATLTGSLIRFSANLDGANDLTIDGDARFDDEVGGAAPLDSLIVNGDTDINGGAITTTGDQRYNGDTILGDDTELTSVTDGVIRFGGALDGPHNLDIQTDEGGLIVFGGNVGAMTPLLDLTLTTAGADGVRGIPNKATIVGESDTSFFVRNFIMGQHEKMTVKGDLLIDASRNAFVGDLVSVGDMTVRAGDTITLLLRDASDLIEADGGVVADRGLDFVAGGDMEFDGAIAFAGAGPDPTFGAVGALPTNAALAGFELSAIDPALVTADALMMDGMVLDQRTTPDDGPGPGPDPDTDPDPDPGPDPVPDPEPQPRPDPEPLPDDIDDELGGADRITPRFTDTIVPDAYNVVQLEQIAIAARGPSQTEAVNGLIGRLIFNDLPNQPSGFGSAYTIAATRMDIDAVERVIDSYESVFGPIGDEQPAVVAQSISAAMARYNAADLAALGIDSADDDPFQTYLANMPGEAEALDYVLNLQRLLFDLGDLGLTPREYERARATLLASLMNESDLTPEQLYQMIRPLRRGAGGTDPAASPAQ